MRFPYQTRPVSCMIPPMKTDKRIRRWPAEWEAQAGVLLAWPHGGTDWAPYLDETLALYRELALAIARFETVVVAAQEPDSVRAALGTAATDGRVRVFEAPINDTWSRDFGPITVFDGTTPRLLDFRFSGWGGKFEAGLDNGITACLHGRGAFGQTVLEAVDLVLEGGSIESDGRGGLLTTSRCLLNPNRNPNLDRAGIEAILSRSLGAKRVLWLENGHLAGDDTDAHIDTLARFAPDDTIVYVRCPDRSDEHYEPLRAMEAELRALRTREGRPYRLVPLPWPAPRFEADGHRLPATYANFLVANHAVLAPVYGDPCDAAALETLGLAFPGREVVGIDCSVLIRQHGSLHCVTMQLPEGVLP